VIEVLTTSWLVGDAADDHDIGALHRRRQRRGVAVLCDIDGAADHGLREHRAAVDKNRRDVEAERLEDALLVRIDQRPRGHGEAVVGDANLAQPLLRVRRSCAGEADGKRQQDSLVHGVSIDFFESYDSSAFILS
jgi:hypothetical protein